MADFEIGEPVKEVPYSSSACASNKYGAIWERAAAMTNGDALPVTFASRKDATNFQAGSAKRAHSLRLRIQTRGNVAYVSRRTD